MGPNKRVAIKHYNSEERCDELCVDQSRSMLLKER